MNIAAHATTGLIQSAIVRSWWPLVGSILPDLPLLGNEIKMRFTGKAFDEDDIDEPILAAYRFTHSLFFAFMLGLTDPLVAFGVIVHQLMDWLSHGDNLRAQPLWPFHGLALGYVTREPRRRALLLSGGWDSVAILDMIDREKYDYFFFDYAQRYAREEREAVEQVAAYYGLHLHYIVTSWGTDCKNRNFRMLMRLHCEGYDRICIGARSPLPGFDRYFDSNLVSLQLFGLVMRMTIETPLIGWTKRSIKARIPGTLINFLHSTEKL